MRRSPTERSRRRPRFVYRGDGPITHRERLAYRTFCQIRNSIHTLDRLVNAVLRPIFVDGGATCGDTAVIVDQTVSTDRQLGIQRGDRVPGGFVQVSVQADNGKSLRCRMVGNVSRNQPFRKVTWSSSKPYRAKFAHLLPTLQTGQTYRMHPFFPRRRRRDSFQDRVSVALKGVGNPHLARGIAVGLEDSAHENGGAASPDAGIDQIAGYAFRSRRSRNPECSGAA